RERTPHALLQADEIVAGMLAGEIVIPGVEQDPLVTGGIVDDTGAELRAVGAAHHERAHRVGAIIDAEGEHGKRGGTPHGWVREKFNVPHHPRLALCAAQASARNMSLNSLVRTAPLMALGLLLGANSAVSAADPAKVPEVPLGSFAPTVENRAPTPTPAPA